MLCVSMPKPLRVHSCRLVRKRWGVCRMPINIAAARSGPIEGIWQSSFQALCFLLSANNSRRTSCRKDLSASSCW
jgi:hypothetical protein